MIAEGDRFTPKQNEALLSKLDILKEAEKLWTDGLMMAVENRAAVGTKNQNEERVRYEFREAEDEDLYKDIEDALAGKLSKKSFHKINDSIPERLARDIERIVGVSVSGYGNEISPGNIAHINKRHGENGTQDHSMGNMHDLARIGYVINNYDKIKEGSISREYKNSDGSPAKTVELQMRIGTNYYYVVEAVPDSKLKTLHVVSAYTNKNDTFSEVAVSKDPSRYVHDEPQSNVSSTDSIRNNSEKSNEKYSLPDESSVYDYVNENETEFIDVPPVRDYERKKQRVRNQTYDELVAQVEKLSRDKRLTHGKVLDKASIKEEMARLLTR